MMRNVTQEQRLDYLVKEFKAESVEYKDLETPKDREGKKRLLRSLMNIRMPKDIDENIVKTQDEYLVARAEEKGVVSLSDIPVMKGCISIWQGDITRLAVDAVVNAANSKMLGCLIPLHACIDNCIHTCAGIRLRAVCDSIMKKQGHEEPVGQAKITPAFNLPCKFVLHTVGPIVQGELQKKHEELLASCYRSCMELAEENGVKSLAFCCISTGVFRFPAQKAAEIAVATVEHWKAEYDSAMKIVFNVFSEKDEAIYNKLIN